MNKSISKRNSLTTSRTFAWMIGLLAAVCIFVFAHAVTAQAAVKKVVFIGDSYVSNSQWPQQTAKKLGLKSGEYVVSARSGAGFGRGVDDKTGVDYSFLKLVKDAANGMSTSERKKVQYVVIAGGYNDTNYVDAWKKYGDSYRDGTDGLKQKIRNAINFSISKFPNAKVLIGAIGHDKVSTKQNGFMQYVGLWYKEVSWEYSGNKVGYMYKAFGNKCLKGYENSTYYVDNAHPNTKGGAIIANAIYGYITIQ